MKIDNHIHITPPDIIKDWKKIAERETYFKWLSTTPQNKFATSDEVVEELRQAGFGKGVVFGFGFKDVGLCRYVNDYCMESVKKYKDELIGFMMTTPEDKQVAYEIERCVKGGLKGVGELFPEGQGYQLTNEKQMTPLMKCCQHYKLPLLLHANEPVGHDYVGKTKTSLHEIETFVTTYNKSPIILAHFGGGLVFYEAMKRQKERYQHVFYDTAAGIFLYEPKVFKMIQGLELIDKIVFGSDFPLVSIKRYENYMKESGLSAEEIDNIMGNNIQMILKC